MEKGQLFIVSTPIGNLQDMTFRAVETLKSVDFLLCEDTRVTKKLLTTYNISIPLQSFHGHSNPKKVEEILNRIESGESAAMVSDAGTPGISDPAFALTSKARERGINIVPVPGCAAFLTALQASGVPINQFVYLGFLPVKKGRKTLFESLQEEKRTVVFYESVHRIQKTLSELSVYLGEDTPVVVARELTKMYEEFFHGTLQEACEHFQNPKGEFVVILSAK